MQILLANNWHHDLGDVLSTNNLTFSTLQELKASELESLCKELNLTTIQTLKMRSLTKQIREAVAFELNCEGSLPMESKDDDELRVFLNDNDLPSNLCDALSSENITFQSLSAIAPYDIDRICNDHYIPIGIKLKLQSAIDKHQIEGLTQNETGSPQYVERIERKENDLIDDSDHKMKLILIGDSAVGKTNLMKRFVLYAYSTCLHFA